MANEKLDWFPIYWQRFIIGTLNMSAEEVGAYLLLLIHQWDKGFVPQDSQELKSICRVSEKKLKKVLGKFEIIDGKYFNKTLEDIRDQQLEKAGKGRIGAYSKWGKDTNKITRSERLSEARKKGIHSKVEWAEMLSFFKVCVKCDSPENIVKDHIIPIYQGGSDSIKNLQPLCSKCNASKGPDNTDYRGVFCTRNACEMPAQWLALREEEKREEEIRIEEKRGEENPSPDLKDPLNFYVGPDAVDDLKIFLEKKFPPILNNLKKDYGEGIYNEAFKRFSEKNIGHNWTDDQDLRKHFTSSLMIFKDNQDAKRTNGPKNSTQSKSSITKGPGKF
jgi:uncharacterized protein YdaU (DUF1376 family)